MRRLIASAAALVALLTGLFAQPAATAGADTQTHYYLSLGDSLAESYQPDGVLDQGYAEQLHTLLAADDPKLKLTKLGCGGESTRSMRFGSQDPSLVSSCGTQRFYQHRYPKGTQLAEAIHFLTKHRGKVDLITIDIGANDLSRLDDQGNEVICLFEPLGCNAQNQQIATNLASILAQLHAAAPGVPVVGMTYYNAFAPIWYSDLELGQLVSDRMDGLNEILDTSYAAAASPVADVAGAFENGVFPESADNACAWTWFCTVGDFHLNTEGYGVVAYEYLASIQQ
jgi:lysophospholipase L1-like esterase